VTAREADVSGPFLRLGRTAVAVALAVLLGACGGATTTPATPTPIATSSTGVAPVDSGPPIPVVGTENFYADLLAQVGGSRVTVKSILDDPNADPHEFESSPAEAALVADARLVVVNGLGYDDFMTRLLGASSGEARTVIDVEDLLGLPPDVNVHVWYDPATMPKVAAAATRALSAIDPANSAYFAAREADYIAALAPIATRIAALRTDYAGTPVAFTEDVAGYLTDEIGLVVKTPVGFMKAIEEGIDPAPVDVAAQQDLFTGKEVRVLVYNSQVTSPTTRRMQDLAAADGIAVVGVSETIPATYPTYQAWQLGQLDDLARALGD
jgi:zinc/manganese transport system substrate-binding protein